MEDEHMLLHESNGILKISHFTVRTYEVASSRFLIVSITSAHQLLRL